MIFIGTIGTKLYFLEGEKIYRVGLNTKRLFPHLAEKTIPSIMFIYKKGDPPDILEIRVDSAYFDSSGKWSVSEFEHRRIAYLIGEALFPNKDDKVSKLKPRPFIRSISEKQKQIIREQFDKDFGSGAWDQFPFHLKMDLWKTGRGSKVFPTSILNTE